MPLSWRDWDRLRQLSLVADVPFFNALTKNLAQNPAGCESWYRTNPFDSATTPAFRQAWQSSLAQRASIIDQDAVADAISFEGTVHFGAPETSGRRTGLVSQDVLLLMSPPQSLLIDHGISFSD